MERNELDAAEPYLLESTEQINSDSFLVTLLRAYVALSRLKTLQGDRESAEHYWQLAEQLEWMSKLHAHPALLSISRVHGWLKQSNLDALEGWSAENQLGLDDEFGYHREDYHPMLVRMYIARRDKVDQAHVSV